MCNFSMDAEVVYFPTKKMTANNAYANIELM